MNHLVQTSEEVAVATASAEAKLTPGEDFKARRLEAIKAKAVEIEKVIRFAPTNDLTFMSRHVANVFNITN